ncbi:hypothetical protein GCM10010319_25040 [Streptomyces blastmyceticus]|uniref:Uncharacterized protein n=1 Tax=Streptomyces blastmyceticus TaxID=68180 RepID=A0ABN0WV50_9ACTN
MPLRDSIAFCRTMCRAGEVAVGEAARVRVEGLLVYPLLAGRRPVWWAQKARASLWRGV